MKDFPLYTEDCHTCGSGSISIWEYGSEAICDNCGETCETDYCDHPEIPGGETEFWIFQDEEETKDPPDQMIPTKDITSAFARYLEKWKASWDLIRNSLGLDPYLLDPKNLAIHGTFRLGVNPAEIYSTLFGFDRSSSGKDSLGFGYPRIVPGKPSIGKSMPSLSDLMKTRLSSMESPSGFIIPYDPKDGDFRTIYPRTFPKMDKADLGSSQDFVDALIYASNVMGDRLFENSPSSLAQRFEVGPFPDLFNPMSRAISESKFRIDTLLKERFSELGYTEEEIPSLRGRLWRVRGPSTFPHGIHVFTENFILDAGKTTEEKLVGVAWGENGPSVWKFGLQFHLDRIRSIADKYDRLLDKLSETITAKIWEGIE